MIQVLNDYHNSNATFKALFSPVVKADLGPFYPYFLPTQQTVNLGLWDALAVFSTTILYWVLSGNFMEFPWLPPGMFSDTFTLRNRANWGDQGFIFEHLEAWQWKDIDVDGSKNMLPAARHGGKSTLPVVVQIPFPAECQLLAAVWFEWKSGTTYACFTFWYIWLQTHLAEDFSSQVDQVSDAELYILKDCVTPVGWSRLHNIDGSFQK